MASSVSKKLAIAASRLRAAALAAAKMKARMAVPKPDMPEPGPKPKPEPEPDVPVYEDDEDDEYDEDDEDDEYEYDEDEEPDPEELASFDIDELMKEIDEVARLDLVHLLPTGPQALPRAFVTVDAWDYEDNEDKAFSVFQRRCRNELLARKWKALAFYKKPWEKRREQQARVAYRPFGQRRYMVVNTALDHLHKQQQRREMTREWYGTLLRRHLAAKHAAEQRQASYWRFQEALDKARAPTPSSLSRSRSPMEKTRADFRKLLDTLSSGRESAHEARHRPHESVWQALERTFRDE